MKIITRVVEHLIINTNPHLGTSLALLFTCTLDLLNPVLMFVLFQAVNQHKSEILADCLVCDISGANFRQNSIDLGLRLTLFRHYFPGSFLFNYFMSQLFHFIIVQHGFQFVNGRFHYLDQIRFTPHLLC